VAIVILYIDANACPVKQEIYRVASGSNPCIDT
jgi:uncharacterized protein YaiI (UPF0178 family)